jgi:hypothetical protein
LNATGAKVNRVGFDSIDTQLLTSRVLEILQDDLRSLDRRAREAWRIAQRERKPAEAAAVGVKRSRRKEQLMAINEGRVV